MTAGSIMWPERLLMPCLGITCVFTVQIFIPCMHGPFIWGFSLTDTAVQLLSFKHCMLRCMGHGIACFFHSVERGAWSAPSSLQAHFDTFCGCALAAHS